MKPIVKMAPVLGVCLLAACVTVPTGPSVMALPGSGKSFEQFRFDDNDCRQFAFSQSGGTTASDAAVDSGVKSAVVGTAIGALAGAALGGHQGAGAGAATGLVVGSVAGSGAASASGYSLQRRYDNAYVQCMYAKGDRVPVSGRFMGSGANDMAPPARPSYPQPPPGYYPPPPSGYPPPPPPDAPR